MTAAEVTLVCTHGTLGLLLATVIGGSVLIGVIVEYCWHAINHHHRYLGK